MSFHKRSFEEIIKALQKKSWRINNNEIGFPGTGPVVVYPDEFLGELFGCHISELVFFENRDNVDGRHPFIKQKTEETL